MTFTLPPLHPILVNFTAALLPASLISDVLGRVLRRESLRSAGWWMILYAAIVTPLTAAAGWLWRYQMGDMDHSEMVIHQWLGTMLSVIFVLLAVWRGRIQLRGETPGVSYLIFTSVIVIALIVQGDLGGRMSFGAAPSEDAAGSVAPASSPGGHEHDQAPQWRDHIDLKD